MMKLMNMTDNDKKLERIRAIVDDIATKKEKYLISEAKKIITNELKKRKEELESQNNLQFRLIKDKLYKEKMQTVLKAEADIKKELLSRRNEVKNQIFLAVETKLNEYINSPKYVTNELEKLKQILSTFACSEITVYVKKSDVEKFEKIMKNVVNKAVIKANEKIRYGGFILVDRKKQISVDMTLDTVLNIEKENFFSLAKLKIV